MSYISCACVSLNLLDLCFMGFIEFGNFSAMISSDFVFCPFFFLFFSFGTPIHIVDHLKLSHSSLMII